MVKAQTKASFSQCRDSIPAAAGRGGVEQDLMSNYRHKISYYCINICMICKKGAVYQACKTIWSGDNSSISYIPFGILFLTISYIGYSALWDKTSF